MTPGRSAMPVVTLRKNKRQSRRTSFGEREPFASNGGKIWKKMRPATTRNCQGLGAVQKRVNVGQEMELVRRCLRTRAPGRTSQGKIIPKFNCQKNLIMVISPSSTQPRNEAHQRGESPRNERSTQMLLPLEEDGKREVSRQYVPGRLAQCIRKNRWNIHRTKPYY